MDLNKLPDDADVEVNIGSLRKVKGPSAFFIGTLCVVSFFLGMAADDDDDPPQQTRVVQEDDD